GRPCGTGCNCGRRPNWRAPRPTASSTRCSARSRSPGERGGRRPGPAMALTGRAALAAAAGALLILAFRAPAMPVVVHALVGGGGAGRRRARGRATGRSRSGAPGGRRGEGAWGNRGVETPPRRPLGPGVGAAGRRSAGPAPPHARVLVPAGGRARLTTALSPD